MNLLKLSLALLTVLLPVRPVLAENPLTVAALNQKAPEKGAFAVRAYVIKQYTCPPCPEAAQCKACMEDNVIVSDTKRRLDTFDLSGEDAIFFVKKPDFDLGVPYLFQIEVAESSSTGKPQHDFLVRGAKRAAE